MSDPTYPPNQNVQRLDRLTNWLLGLILVIPFLISFGALRDLAAHNAISYPWLYPNHGLSLRERDDGGLIIFKAIALRSSLRGKRDSYAWAMAVLATVISVYLNIVHVPPTLPTLGLARFMAALPPLVILVSFIAVSRRIEESARHDKTVFTYQQIQKAIVDKKRQLDRLVSEKTAELDAIVQERSEKADKLDHQIGRLEQYKANLLSEIDAAKSNFSAVQLSNLGKMDSNLDSANAVRLSKKEQAMQDLLDFVLLNPDASLSDIADQIGRARSTVGNYVTELSHTGLLHKNGRGWEVVSN